MNLTRDSAKKQNDHNSQSLRNSQISGDRSSIVLTEEEFNSYKALGYFDGVAYEWSMFNGVYTVFMSPEDYQQFLESKGIRILK